MRSAPGAVEVFTVGRLVKALPATNPKRTELYGKFRDSLGQLMPGEATLRCRVLLHQMEGEPDKAEELLRKSIDEAPRTPAGSVASDVYFQRCTLGAFLIDLDRLDDAIDILMPAVSSRYGGEAKFHLAIAYGKKRQGRDAARWLREAIDELPKWAAHARDHSILRNISEVADVLASHSGANRQRAV